MTTNIFEGPEVGYSFLMPWMAVTQSQQVNEQQGVLISPLGLTEHPQTEVKPWVTLVKEALCFFPHLVCYCLLTEGKNISKAV